MKSINLLSALVLCFVWSCKSDQSSAKDTGTKGKKVEYQAFPMDKISQMRSEATSVDLISLKKDVNISMSFDNPQSVSIIMSFFTEEAGLVTNLCLPDAHLMVQKNGEILQEMDLFYQNGCNAMVFMDVQQNKLGANKISKEGIDFFNNFLKSKTSQDSLGR